MIVIVIVCVWACIQFIWFRFQINTHGREREGEVVKHEYPAMAGYIRWSNFRNELNHNKAKWINLTKFKSDVRAQDAYCRKRHFFFCFALIRFVFIWELELCKLVHIVTSQAAYTCASKYHKYNLLFFYLYLWSCLSKINAFNNICDIWHHDRELHGFVHEREPW